ncbi:hypothetical protein G9409_09815 [Chlorobium sp. BLA1]|uniref:restriction endonuclease subunit S n=1 Tax=Candidatus Chlorobium masyuteum TaxID=2716876 RepID=UPI001422A4F6|nr:restriction endonuclease subunit S [Candidatus Chlorobium masyuteum]NHQ60869.1 hypothetical protein [Candidatus Chlorobium masyuteum]
MSRHQKYPAYKNSGVEWIGEIPEHWEVKQTRHVFRIFSGSTPKSGEELFWDGDITWFTPEDLGNNQQNNISESRKKITEDGYKSCGTSLAKANSLVLSTRAPIGHIALSTVPACCNQGCRILEPENSCSGYWYYTLLSAKPALQSLGQGSTFMELPRQSLASFKLPYPPLEEQQAIASFLDRKTAQIDELITKKEELLKKLDEKRTALITQAVTKGIDPSAPMKESGVEWIGRVPTHWKVTRIKFLFPRLYSGVSVNSDAFPSDQDSIGVLKTSCVYGNRFSPEENKKVIDEETEQVACSVTKDSVIISRMNTPDLVGSCGYVEFDYPNLFLPDRLWIARFENHKKMVGKYAWYLIISDTVIKLTGVLATGTSGSMKNLSQDSFLNIATAVPPIEEQQAITKFLDNTTATIDRQKAQVTEAIERLKEYRNALITDTVTGKMDVHLHGKK